MGSAGSAISTAGRSPAVGIKSCVKQKLPLGIIKPPKLQETALLFSTGRLVMSDHLEVGIREALASTLYVYGINILVKVD